MLGDFSLDGLVGLSALGAAHFANKDPDEPEASREEGHERISDKVPKSVLTHGFSFHRGVLL